MNFIEDPINLNRVIDPEHNWSLTRFTTDVPRGERHYYFLIEGVNFLVEMNFSISEVDKTITVDGQEKKIEDSFNRYCPGNIRFDDPRRVFRETILPSLREALECLEGRRLLPRHKLEGWKIAVKYTKPGDRSAPASV